MPPSSQLKRSVVHARHLAICKHRSPNNPRPYPATDFCSIEVNRSAWTGRLIVTGDHEQYGYAWHYYMKSLRVDGVRGACTSVLHDGNVDYDYDFCQAQVAQERVPELLRLENLPGTSSERLSSVGQPDVDVRPHRCSAWLAAQVESSGRTERRLFLRQPTCLHHSVERPRRS